MAIHQPHHKRMAIFDLDGCVSDDAWRRRFILGEGVTMADHATYHEMADKDDALTHGAELINMHMQNGDFIVFCTARPITIGTQTIEWIKKHTVLKEPEQFGLMMRKAEDERAGVEIKREMAIEIKKYANQHDLEVAVAYDDRDDICEMWLAEGFPAARLDAKGSAPITTPQNQFRPEPQPVHPISTGEPPQAMAVNTNALTLGADAKRYAVMMLALHPDGLTLRTEADFIALFSVTQAVGNAAAVHAALHPNAVLEASDKSK